jgi:hypothetical protein
MVSRDLQAIAKGIDDRLKLISGKRCGFILLVWAGKEVNYVGSDNDRARVIKAMRELIEKWERGDPDPPAHQRH